MEINMQPYVCKLSQEIQDKAREELNEEASRRAADIKTFRNWLVKQPHIFCRTDDEFLLRFLRNSKFSIEGAKEKLDNYYTLKADVPEWYTNRDQDNPVIKSLIKIGIFVPLGYDDSGSRIIVTRPGAYDPSKVKLDDIMKVNNLMMDYCLLDEQTQVCGINMITDMKKFSGAHMATFTPGVAKKLMLAWQDSTPIRTRSLNYVNTPGIFEAAFSIVKPFLKKKMIDRVKVHGSDMKSLHSVVAQRHLPNEYGGTAGPLQDFADATAKELLLLKDYLYTEECYKVDETKRPETSKSRNNLFGLDGTFRKLEFD